MILKPQISPICSFNCFDLANHEALSTSSAHNADDTLEEIEYVLDRGLNYVPKRLVNEIKLQSAAVKQEENKAASIKHLANASTASDAESDCENTNNANKPVTVDSEVIVVDSSPENSFTSTLTTAAFKSAFESIDNTFYTAKSILHHDVSVVSINSDDSDEHSLNGSKSDDESTQTTIEQSQPCEIQTDKTDISQKPDVSMTDSMEMSTSTQIDNPAAAAAVAPAVDNDLEMPAFNDSLERIEYMMEQAQKMMSDKVKVSAPATHTATTKTPVSQTKLKPKVLTPNGVSLKKGTPKHLTPNKVDPFKRPDQRNARSPFTGKAASASKLQPHGQSRIPTKTGSSHKQQFRHIASPIAAYIKHTPEVPLVKTVKTVKSMRNLLTEDFDKVCKTGTSSLDESTQSVESFPTKAALPRKMYISAPQRKVSKVGGTIHETHIFKRNISIVSLN